MRSGDLAAVGDQHAYESSMSSASVLMRPIIIHELDLVAERVVAVEARHPGDLWALRRCGRPAASRWRAGAPAHRPRGRRNGGGPAVGRVWLPCRYAAAPRPSPTRYQTPRAAATPAASRFVQPQHVAVEARGSPASLPVGARIWIWSMVSMLDHRGNVPVLLRRVGVALVLQHFQRGDQPGARMRGSITSSM